MYLKQETKKHHDSLEQIKCLKQELEIRDTVNAQVKQQVTKLQQELHQAMLQWSQINQELGTNVAKYKKKNKALEKELKIQKEQI